MEITEEEWAKLTDAQKMAYKMEMSINSTYKKMQTPIKKKKDKNEAREKKLAYNKEWYYERTPEERKEYNHNRYKKRLERFATDPKYREEFLAKRREYDRKRRAKKEQEKELEKCNVIGAQETTQNINADLPTLENG